MAFEMKMQEAHDAGKSEGRREERLTFIRNLMKKTGWTAKEAMDALMLPEDEQELLISII